MNPRHEIKITGLIAIAMIACGVVNSGFAWDYGNGRHGSYVLTTNATIEQLYQTVRLTNDPAQYNPTNSNAIPNFQNLIITNGATLTANAWDGSSGGWIVLKVEETLSVASGSAISATGIGYRGGGGLQQGESFAGGQGGSSSANYGGGGGGDLMPNGYFTSAGGGSYATAGGTGGGNPYSTYNGIDYRGVGGITYGDQTLATIYLGSGGGGGGVYAPAPYLYAFTGGSGGGAIILNAGNFVIKGQILANGDVPYYNVSGTPSVASYGGGGSGGSIVLRAKTATLGTNLITANGGSASGNGGSGGIGRIMVGYFSGYTGVTTPAAYALQDTNSDNITLITSQPMSQTNFWSSNAVINVVFTGYPPFTYQWFFNGVPIPTGTNKNLTLLNLDFTNQGNYSVIISNAVGVAVSSNAYLTIWDPREPLGDGIPNWFKTLYGLSLTDSTLATNFPPGDKLTYFQKYFYGLNPLTNDTDGDGLSDYDELFVYHTNPISPDTAGDGIPDGWKVQYGVNPLIAIANDVAGFDGVTYMQVYQYDLTHTNQLNPNVPFAGGSGLSNYEFINNGQHTNNYYYDHEDRLLGVESSHGISIGYQYDGNGNLLQQSVLSRASETNGLPLLWLWLNGLTNEPGIAYANSNGNGWNNYQEWLAGLSPNSNSVPSLLNNPGTNIAAITFPFTPSNCVVAAGQMNRVAGDEIIVGADGDATGKTNSLFILTQGASSWQVQQLPVGALGITSIAVGQPTNRPSPAIYVGLRQTGGTGAIWELLQTNGLWQTNVLVVSTNEAAYVLGVRSADVLGSFSTNGLNAALYSLAYTNGVWDQTIISTNSSHRGLGTDGSLLSHSLRDSSVRLLDTGGIEIIGGSIEGYKDNIRLPTIPIQNPATGKWHFSTPSSMSWSSAESYFTNYHGKLALPTSAAENMWMSVQFPAESWIGLYYAYNSCWSPYYADGSSAGNCSYGGFANWALNMPYVTAQYTCVALNYGPANYWGILAGSTSLPGIGELTSPVYIFTNQWLINEPPATSRFAIRGLSLAVGLPRPNQTNSTSIFYAFADDQNLSGQLDAGDDFTLAEYVVSGNTWTTSTLFQAPITAAIVAQSFGLVAVNFTGTGKDTLFTGEPEGRVYSWTGTDATSPLQRQLFSDAYVGKAWQAMCGVQMPASGEGLAGLMIDPTNQSLCNVIFWTPQAVLPTPQPSLVETAPFAAVIPATTSLGSNAVVTVRLWDNEGDASTPFLQYQMLGATNWQNATLTTLDGSPYNLATRVTALPTGNNHTVGWNALADVGANVVTNILLRASAQDFMLTGAWSQPTPFLLNTAITTIPTNPPVNFTGITTVQGGIQFNWQGGSNTWLYLQRSPALAGTNANWVNVWTGVPPMLDFGSYTDFFGTNRMEFYRLKIDSP